VTGFTDSSRLGGSLRQREDHHLLARFAYDGQVIQTIVFFLVLGFPLIVYLINAALAQRESRGIAAGIPKPKEAKSSQRTGRPAKVRPLRVQSCGRHGTHLILALLGSADSCRFCTYLQQPGATPTPDGDDEREAAIRAAEEIIDRANQ